MNTNRLSNTDHSRIKRMPERAHLDRATVNAIIDSGRLAHIGYVIDGMPYVTPTAHWCDADYIYWHGSSASRMLRAQSENIPVCVTISHLDGFVLARSAFHHSMNYRSVMLFGKAEWVEDEAHKIAALKRFTDSLFPERFDTLRPINAQELKATRVLRMKIEEGSAKVRNGPPKDDEEDLSWPVWAGVIPLTTHQGVPQPDAATSPDIAPPI